MNVPIVAELVVGKKKVPIDAETGIYLLALLNEHTEVVQEDALAGHGERFVDSYLKIMGDDDFGVGDLSLISIETCAQRVFDALQTVLKKSTSWRKSRPPQRIATNFVTYRADGIQVGCQSLTLAQMEAMVAECKKSGEKASAA